MYGVRIQDTGCPLKDELGDDWYREGEGFSCFSNVVFLDLDFGYMGLLTLYPQTIHFKNIFNLPLCIKYMNRNVYIKKW